MDGHDGASPEAGLPSTSPRNLKPILVLDGSRADLSGDRPKRKVYFGPVSIRVLEPQEADFEAEGPCGSPCAKRVCGLVESAESPESDSRLVSPRLKGKSTFLTPPRPTGFIASSRSYKLVVAASSRAAGEGGGPVLRSSLMSPPRRSPAAGEKKMLKAQADCSSPRPLSSRRSLKMFAFAETSSLALVASGPSQAIQ